MKISFHNLFILLPLAILAGCSESQDNPDSINDFLANPRELSPSNIHIDFDGDGIIDKIFVSGLKGTATDLKKVKTLVHPWPFDKQGVNTEDLSSGSKNNFYIVLSKTKTGYIVSDANPISILDTEAAQELFAVKKSRYRSLGLTRSMKKPKVTYWASRQRLGSTHISTGTEKLLPSLNHLRPPECGDNSVIRYVMLQDQMRSLRWQDIL